VLCSGSCSFSAQKTRFSEKSPDYCTYPCDDRTCGIGGEFLGVFWAYFGCTKARFFLRRQPRNFENTTLVARRREHFLGLLAIFLVAQLSPKRGVLVHKNSLASCQRCRHSVGLWSAEYEKKFLSDFKWAGHRLAHIFADDWSTGSHKRRVTLLEAPTGTLLFNYKDIKQEIVHTLL